VSERNKVLHCVSSIYWLFSPVNKCLLYKRSEKLFFKAVSSFSPNWPQTSNPPSSASQMLRLQTCATMSTLRSKKCLK
jgi:hypothetical protein